MLRILFKILIALFIALALLLLWVTTFNKPKQQHFETYGLAATTLTLAQNWSADIRQQMAHTNFGSKILPLEWLLHLEHPDQSNNSKDSNPTLLIDSPSMLALGFIPQKASANNPHALPIGFSLETQDQTPWVGLTCAACHTSLIRHKGHEILIDGGSGLINFAQFERDILKAITLTLAKPERFARFAHALKASNTTLLHQQLIKRQQYLTQRFNHNATAVDYGHGRLDAFGIIFNSIAAEALDMPQNARPPDAPVSIPVLWDASHHDLVQWNGSAPNKEPGPLGQNIPTALAVYGDITLQANRLGGYTNGVAIKNLGYMQQQYYKLTSPQWPSAIFGHIDQQKAQAGQKIYHSHCQRCHAVIDTTAPKRKLTSVLVDLEIVGTDPVMATNFVERRVKSGPLEGKKMGVLAGPPLKDDVQPIALVMNAAIGSMLNNPISTVTAIATQYADNLSAPLDFTRKAYRARSLNGVWSSAPYLHNGSVPTLWALLQPSELRPKTFYVGNNRMDLTHVGFMHEQAPNTSLFDTTLYANSNQGHEFGTHLSEPQKWALIEYLKTL